MKRILTTCALACVLLLAACNGKNDPSNKLRGNAMLYINVEQSTARAEVTNDNTDNNTMDTQKLLTPKEIVEQAYGFIFDNIDGYDDVRLGIADAQRDVENARFKMWGDQIIKEDGTLETYFIRAKNIKIVSVQDDGYEPIIAYIPNKVMDEAWEKIQAAHNAGNYDEVYKLFQDAYTAIPTTTAEYNKLKEKGEH